MALTGRRDGPALLGTGSPASAVRAALDVLARAGVPDLPGVGVLGERAACAGTVRNAPWSAGGSFRMVHAADGWFGVSLARPSDLHLVPALVERDIAANTSDEAWDAVAAWAQRTTSESATARARLLSMAAAAVFESVPQSTREPVRVTMGGRRPPAEGVLVLDLSSLWAGPLCAHLLGLAGARVVKVESRMRLDGTRRGPRTFYDLLHAGHDSVVLDFASQRKVLGQLRPRALAELGIDALAEVARGAVWISITAAGRENGMRVGFGDDVACGAGLVAWENGLPCPMGDAVADPLTGVTAAAAAVTAIAGTHGALLDVSMHDVCAAAAQAPRSGPSDVAASQPAIRAAVGQARRPGADTATVLAELRTDRRSP
jgi:hypothetical protein